MNYESVVGDDADVEQTVSVQRGSSLSGPDGALVIAAERALLFGNGTYTAIPYASVDTVRYRFVPEERPYEDEAFIVGLVSTTIALVGFIAAMDSSMLGVSLIATGAAGVFGAIHLWSITTQEYGTLTVTTNSGDAFVCAAEDTDELNSACTELTTGQTV